MTTLVVDASVAVKWLVEEKGTREALALRSANALIAPDLLLPECANILWKKVRKGEIGNEEAVLAARLLSVAGVEIVPTLPLFVQATELAVALDHPAYDCVYLALAVVRDCSFVTADSRLISRIARARQPGLLRRVLLLYG